MGAWGHQFDENDDAADWLGEFSDSPAWDACAAAFSAIDGDYVEAPECSCAIAAAEVVAAGLGKPSDRLDDAIIDWATEHADGAPSLKNAAVAALLRIRNDSELAELWNEGDADEWLATIDDLNSRLN